MFIKKIQYPTGKREIYFCNIKILQYYNWKAYDLQFGFPNYNDLENTQNISYGKNDYSPRLSIVYPIYYTKNDFSNFYSLIELYDKLSDKIKKDIEIIIVDDCSTYPLRLPQCNLNISLLRICKNIKWNQSGARNLGACFSNSSKLLLMDAEWYAPEDTLQDCIDINLKNHTFKPMKWAKTLYGNCEDCLPNIFLINKPTFFLMNCYDENWCGLYGEDLFFRRYIFSKGIKCIVNNKPIIPCCTCYVTNNSHNLSRNLNEVKRRLSKVEKPIHTKKILQFPWEVVEVKFLNQN